MKDDRVQRKTEVGSKVRRENSVDKKIVFEKEKHTIIRKLLRPDL